MVKHRRANSSARSLPDLATRDRVDRFRALRAIPTTSRYTGPLIRDYTHALPPHTNVVGPIAM